jgi:hypothetical protein
MIISLDVQPAADGTMNILGQLATDNQDDWTGALVQLQIESLSSKTSTVDDLGAFHFEEIIPGAIQMTITSPHGIMIQIANIDIGT